MSTGFVAYSSALQGSCPPGLATAVLLGLDVVPGSDVLSALFRRPRGSSFEGILGPQSKNRSAADIVCNAAVQEGAMFMILGAGIFGVCRSLSFYEVLWSDYLGCNFAGRHH